MILTSADRNNTKDRFNLRFIMHDLRSYIEGMTIQEITIEILTNSSGKAVNKMETVIENVPCNFNLSAVLVPKQHTAFNVSVQGIVLQEMSEEDVICIEILNTQILPNDDVYANLIFILSEPTFSFQRLNHCRDVSKCPDTEKGGVGVALTSSWITGSRQCCEVIVHPVIDDLHVFIINPTSKTNLPNTRHSPKSYLIGNQKEIFQIQLNSSHWNISVHNVNSFVKLMRCKSVDKDIKEIVGSWRYNESEITLYDQVCQCGKTSPPVVPYFCYAVQVPFAAVHKTSIRKTSMVSPPMVSKNKNCAVMLTSVRTFKTLLSVNIISKNRTVFHVKDEATQFDLYNHHIRKHSYLIGRIDEEFQVEVKLYRQSLSSLLGILAVQFRNCDKPSINEKNCSSTEYMCQTGLCVPKSKHCNLAKDCYHDDDEEKCDSDIGKWNCNFENSTCTFLHIDNQTRCSSLKVRSVTSLSGKLITDHTRRENIGTVLYAERIYPCKYNSIDNVEFSTDFLPERISARGSNCKMGISSIAARLNCWWNVLMCDKIRCLKIFQGNSTTTWNSDVILIPNHSKRYYINFTTKRLSSQCNWIAFDDLTFSPGCFTQDHGVEYSDDEWFIKTLVPIVCCVLFIEMSLVVWAVCQRKCCSYGCFHSKKHSSSGRTPFNIQAYLSPLSLTNINDILVESNPNYAWFSDRVLENTIQNIPFSQVHISTIIGKGAFGEVYKGHLTKNTPSRKNTVVAIKKLPAGPPNETRADFIFEALTLSKFNHKNIVRCLGISSSKGELLLILEYMAGGDLKNYLRLHKDKMDIPVQQLLKIAIDIAHGCKYLTDNKFIHRDIASRNCLLDVDLTAKIADFGLARDVITTDYYRKLGKAALPVRWMAEEAFVDGKFTFKSDVWSYGILLWEIFSHGAFPYPGLTNDEVMTRVISGYRMESPKGCPSNICSHMKQCWHKDPEDRPTFETLIDWLSDTHAEISNKVFVQSQNGIHFTKTNAVKHRMNSYDSPHEGAVTKPLLEQITLDSRDDVFTDESTTTTFIENESCRICQPH